MENDKASTKKIIINYGVILGILSVLMGVVIYVMDGYAEQNWVHSVIGLAIMVGVTVYGIKAYKAANGGFLKLGEAIKIGLGIALIGGIISVIWTILLMSVIEPDIVNQMNEVQREQMIERFPDMPEEQLNQSLEMTKKFTTPYMLSAFALIWSLFIGFIISLFAGLAMQKKQDLY
ncbi:amino acid transporter [Aquimarina sp. EL_43]|uniref:DUF4199 domain-containing protein n=1 Tax=unclassified Aquimarina TaxID=2627091 RepID=UPI0018CBD3BC|nr:MULTISPECIES: DUF4199 domain-containing protein [unclassified Aquimarina]MBG6129302.1 amino acid transporter [Aquimarina sp. EL_35]MBG6150367.1 amino acid transporter [Aquimarina sp. EL_32]MBG6166947.1 amino acid transporter [Aquimarina sp. EL_43]